MKFGKRLVSEAGRKGSWSSAFADYKNLKSAIKDDIANQDAEGPCFQLVLVAELKKVSRFYSERVDNLEEALRQAVASGSSVQLTQLRAEIKEMIKFVALNYLAVVKAIKKRNRHLKEAFGSCASTTLQPMDLLEHEVFFTSPRLAALATQAEVLFNELASTSQPSNLEDYQCPICLDTMHNPVVLTCAHRFCWGCLVAHVTAVREQSLPLQTGIKGSPGSDSLSVLQRIAADDSEPQRKASTSFTCPVCRKPQVFDVESLAVDPYLSSYIEALKAMTIDTAAPSMAVGAPADSCSSCDAHAEASSMPAPPAAPRCEEEEQHQQQVAPVALPQRQRSAGSVGSPPAPTLRWGIIPQQAPQHAGRLCVLLDLDGTLVSSYTPRRAPRLPSYVRTHVVGVGSKLNPSGVFVVERPGLREFLEQLSSFAEVIIFTAGLEDYAKPIIDAIDPRGKFFAGRIYREGTLRTDYYQCVKDMARVNRDLARTVLVDDTPLAFLHQPDNGVPVLGFRGDPDDRLLLEAVLPLMQVLAKEPDVRTVLQRRFDMTTWFMRNSFPIEQIMAQAAEAVREEAEDALCALRGGAVAPSSRAQRGSDAASGGVHAHVQLVNGSVAAGCQHAALARASFSGPRLPSPTKRWLLLADFDKTLTDFDAGEAVVEQLAPELLPMLVGLDNGGPNATNFVPLTNQILGEMQRRGVSRDQLLTALQGLGADMPLACCEMLRMMHSAGVDVKILSDCNSVFVSHMLAGAKVAGYVQEVITNPASFERVGSSGDAAASQAQQHQQLSIARSEGHRLVIKPHYNTAHAAKAAPCASPSASACQQQGCSGSAACQAAAHGCPLCPDNMCKGLELQRIQHHNMYERIIYAGDGANDICPVLSLGRDDVVLARKGHPLANYILESLSNPALRRVEARVALWSSHEELLACVRQVLDI